MTIEKENWTEIFVLTAFIAFWSALHSIHQLQVWTYFDMWFPWLCNNTYRFQLGSGDELQPTHALNFESGQRGKNKHCWNLEGRETKERKRGARKDTEIYEVAQANGLKGKVRQESKRATHIHARARARAHTHTHTHTHTHAHTHTHTHRTDIQRTRRQSHSCTHLGIQCWHSGVVLCVDFLHMVCVFRLYLA